MFNSLRCDIQAVRERDPAARTTTEIVLCYAGLHAIWMHRVWHFLWRHGFKLAARLGSQCSRFCTGIEIHPGARLGRGLFIDHGMAIVIGETAEIGANVTLYHGVTLGGTTWQSGKRHPTLEDNVVVGAGAKILGAITVGAGARIGANAVVVKPVPPDAVVVGVPGQIVTRSKTTSTQSLAGADAMPDTIGVTLVSLMQRVGALEAADVSTPADDGRASVNSQAKASASTPRPVPSHPSLPHDGVWRGEDFSI